MTPFLSWPDRTDIVVRDVRVLALSGGADDLARVDVRLAGGVVAEIGVGLAGDGVACGGCIALPGFVDLHTHLDKGHIWPRASNPDGTGLAARAIVAADREANWTADDVATRFDFALRCAYAHGTVAIRTHIDSLGAQLAISWPVFERLRAEWAGRIALQGVALVPLDAYATPWAEQMADIVAACGGLLGGSGALEPDAPALIARVFALAADRDLDIDLHADETLDPAAHTLRLIAQETIRRGWQGRVTCGHCCSLAMQDPAEARETIAMVADAGITVVCLPMVNLYLQGRAPGVTPRFRGITLVHELRAAGVRVVLASDNTRDPFYGFGDLDPLEVLREGVRIGHLDLPVGAWPAAVTALPADVMGLHAGRLRVGAPADLVLFAARSYSELFARPHADRLVLRNGRPTGASQPPYHELDRLFT